MMIENTKYNIILTKMSLSLYYVSVSDHVRGKSKDVQDFIYADIAFLRGGDMGAVRDHF